MPRVLSVDVLERFMSNREIAELFTNYKANRKASFRVMQEPSAEDKRIAKAVAEAKSVGKVAKQMSISVGRVNGAVLRTFCFQ